MRKFIVISLLIVCFSVGKAQYISPAEGVHWTLDSLVLYSNGAVTGSAQDFVIHEDITIAASDSLFILSAVNVEIAPAVQMSIFGFIETGSDGGPTLQSLDPEEVYAGFRVEAGAVAIFRNTIFPDGGGFKLISGEVFFDNCLIASQENISTSSAAIECFTGGPSIINCSLIDNDGAAISSPANIDCWPTISGNFISGNNTLNSNRPQVNLGPSGAANPIILQFNTIIGNPFLDQVGGIAVANLVGGTTNVWVQGNTVTYNRYGIAILGNGISAVISDNVILENSIQGDPILGGSGINLNGNNSSSAVVSNNFISGNLWGITVQGNFQLDMGNPDLLADSPGNNTFDNNGNGGAIYALYNNTPESILAVNNCWVTGQESSAAQVEEVIFHAADDASLGLVDYSFFQCGVPSSLAEEEARELIIYPNPVSDFLTIDMGPEMVWKTARLWTMSGTKLSVSMSAILQGRLDMSYLAKGLYILELQSDAGLYRTTFLKD